MTFLITDYVTDDVTDDVFQTVSTVEYTVSGVGVYTVSLKWEGQQLVGSPFTVPAVAIE